MAATAIAAALLLSACGSSDDDDASTPGGDTAGTEGLTTVKAAVPPAATFAPVWLGAELGFFEAEGIDLQLDPQITGPSINAAVASGNLQVGGTVWAALIPAVVQELPLIGISNITVGGATPEDDDTAIVATPQSGVNDASQLRGKTIAVPNVASLGAVQIAEIALAAGVNPDEYTLTQVDFPNMPAALRTGQIEVAYVTEPYLTMAQQDMELTVLPEGTNSAVMDHMPLGVLGANSDWAADHPDLVAAIQRAMVAATEYANEHPEAVRDSLRDRTGLPAEIADAVRLPAYAAAFDIDKVQQVADLMVEHEIAPRRVDMNEYSIPVA